MSASSWSSPGASRAGSPRNLLTTNPAMSAWSSGESTATVPNRCASRPPRSMSPTTTTGRLAARASPIFAKSVARRLISAGDPAPSQITTSNSARRPASSSATTPARRVAMLDVVGRTDRADRLAAHQQLRGAVAAGFEQDRIEPDAGRQTRGAGLHALGPADLAAVDGDHRVVAHILRLERRNPNSLARQQPAQTRDHHRLAGIGRGAGDQQRPPHRERRRPAVDCVLGEDHGRVRISAPSSVTTSVCSNWAVHLRSLVATVQPSSQIS